MRSFVCRSALNCWWSSYTAVTRQLNTASWFIGQFSAFIMASATRAVFALPLSDMHLTWLVTHDKQSSGNFKPICITIFHFHGLCFTCVPVCYTTLSGLCLFWRYVKPFLFDEPSLVTEVMNIKATFLCYCLAACLQYLIACNTRGNKCVVIKFHAIDTRCALTFSSECLMRFTPWSCVKQAAGEAWSLPGWWTCYHLPCQQGIISQHKGFRCQDLAELNWKLSNYDNSVANTSRIHEIAHQGRGNVTSTRVSTERTESVLSTKRGDDRHPSENTPDYHSCRMASKSDRQRQKCNLYRAFLSRRIKTPSTLKVSVHISDCVDSKSTSKSELTEQSFKQITWPTVYKISIKLPLEISHCTSFPSLINSYINGKKGKKNVELITEIAAILLSLNKQENTLHAANENNKQTNENEVPDGKVDKCIPTSYLACFSDPWEELVKTPVIAGCVLVALDRICGKGYCNPMECYFEGCSYTLHKLQQKGEFHIVSKNLE